MDKFSFISLWDVYGGLLTDVRQEITDMYFNLDLTVSEIAAEKGISRQAVSDCLKGCKKQLEGYEGKLHLLDRLQKDSLGFSCLLTDAGRWAENLRKTHPELAEEVSSLEQILNKDYTDEVSEMLEKSETKELLNKDYAREVFGAPKTGED